MITIIVRTTNVAEFVKNFSNIVTLNVEKIGELWIGKFSLYPDEVKNIPEIDDVITVVR